MGEVGCVLREGSYGGGQAGCCLDEGLGLKGVCQGLEEAVSVSQQLELGG